MAIGKKTDLKELISSRNSETDVDIYLGEVTVDEFVNDIKSLIRQSQNVTVTEVVDDIVSTIRRNYPENV